ncbi:tetratricopeptide repeat protein [Burkholderia cepacia]|uniref:tetratricopeptide repeat protein n=1 Tax=Burkholderia cepacia TaxID=292 RepID=UPI001C9359B8|nr:tetratricopeptide repeat protein [Burkholderia cepacia]MBY4713527.1 sel1 repeat family protein [Burkholderia cepacia]MBY4741165.1 sel1 repeat family protein [Burkholderia cepacia]MBY4748538.1 sel1 repeat family protein [Burkholderia cepacia]MBY4762172.1 sel1 repeat family protein [Burkholderia cepacia]MBY4775854.1 sel1 repeat family protein [Burkholderia cepacia]
MNDGDGACRGRVQGGAGVRRRIGAMLGLWCVCGVYGVCIAAGTPGAPQAKSDPSRETQSAVADYNAGDYRAALVQFHDAAERGDRLAQFNYAMMLLTGEGVTANVDEGLRWLKRAADANMSHAQYVYGRMLDDGEFVARNPAEAHRWFLRAAKQGHVQAELSLANQFLDGRGTPRDNRQAFVWYKQAADAGEPTAQYVTASFYERGGDGVEQNLNIARAYYAAAAAQGDETAGLKFKELSARLKVQGPASGTGAEPGGPHAPAP